MTIKTKTIIKNIINLIEYDKCYLFGSTARGTNTKFSDIDLLIILKEQIDLKKKRNLSTFLRKQFAKKSLDVDVILKTHQEVEYLKNKPGSIVQNALAEGIPAW